MLQPRDEMAIAAKPGGGMRKGTRTILLASMLGGLTTAPALCDTWSLRPGLWETTFITDSSAVSSELQARTEELAKKIPPPKPMQFCQKANASSPAKPIFDPANQPPGTCREKILSESPTEREVEDVCMFSATGGGTAGPGQAHRHIILVGDGAGTIDQADFTSGPSGKSLTRKFRWLSADCGAIPPTPN